MDHRTFRDLCLSLPGADSYFPFDQVTEVFRVGGKMFALCSTTQGPEWRANLKCDPDLGAELRTAWPRDVFPGWHMNKRHWITIRLNGDLEDSRIAWLVEHSHGLVEAKLPRRPGP